MLRTILAGLCGLLLTVAAQAQSVPLQGGPWEAGHAPMYLNSGNSQPVIQDSGPAGGGDIGLGMSEGLYVARGVGTPPYAGQGTGPDGSNWCDYDAPTTNATGYHVLCLSPNADGGGLIYYNAAGGAAQLPLTLSLNGTDYQFPFSISGIVGPVSSVVNDIACWNNITGNLLKDCAGVTISGGVVNVTGTFQKSGTTENFPPSGNIVGTTDSQTLTNKSIVASQLTSATVTGTYVFPNSLTVSGTLLAPGPTGVSAPRQTLTTSLNLYVNGNSGSSASCLNHTQTCSAGSDSNDCLTVSTPCLSLQHVLTQIFAKYDIAGHGINVWLAENTGTVNYDASCAFGALDGGITFNINGDVNDQTDTVILAPNSNYAVFTKDGCSLVLNNLSFKDQGTTAGAIHASNGAIPGGVDAESVCFLNTWNNSSTLVVADTTGAVVNMLGSASGSVTPNCINSTTSIGSAFYAANGGQIVFANQNIAVPNAFSVGGLGFGVIQGGFMSGIQLSQFTGAGASSVTGPRCSVIGGYVAGGSGTNPNAIFLGNANCAPRAPSLSYTQTFASLPACSNNNLGALMNVSDSTTNTWGATITGGSTVPVLAYCDSVNWTVAAK